MPHFLNQNIQQMFWNPVNVWLVDHPLWHWLLAHPFVFLGLSLLVLLLLAGLISAIAQLTQNLWLRLLRLPIQLVQALGKAIASGIQHLFTRSPQPPTPASPLNNSLTPKVLDASALGSYHAELEDLWQRLEQLQQEEAELLEKIKALVQDQAAS